MSPTRSIAVLAPHLDMHYYYVGILAGIHEVAQQHGVQVIGIRVDRPRLISPPSLCWDRVDGWVAIMHGEGLESIALAAPLVTIGGAYLPSLNCPTVMPENAGGTEALVSHLIDHGHTNIAFVGYLENPDIRQRYEGYQRALTKRSIPFDPRLICPCPVDGFGEHDGREAAKRLMGLGLPCTAIVGGTDLIAIGVMDALKAAHVRVPGDVAVVGFDDLYLAQYTTPALTTVRHPFEALGRAACRLVLAQIAGQTAPSGITYVDTTPVLRRSCGCGTAFMVPGVRTVKRSAPIAWRDALARQVVDLAQGSRPDARTLRADMWPGAIDLVEALIAVVDNVQGPSPVALERAWQEAVALMVDLDTLHAIHTLLERIGMERLADDSVAEARLKAFLDLSYVEMMRAYRARNIGRTSRIQGLIHTNYEISTEISTWRGLGTGRGQRLAWLRHTPARWGCLGRWTDPEAGQGGTIVVTDTYTAAGPPLVPVGSQYTAASFPPDQFLPAPGHQGDREMVALVPFQTPGRDWWVLAVCLTLETQFLTDRENLGMWATLLGASLEREALLASLANQQERLGVANRDLLAAKEVAEKADALKTRLLANVSHELRTPLDAILSYSQAALTVPNSYHLDLPSGLRHDLQHIVQSSEHVIRLINDLLDLSRAEVDALELFPESIETHSFLEEAFRTIAHCSVAGGEVRWHLELSSQLPVVEADPVRLRQILFNLLSNARKFTSAGDIVLGANVTPPHLHIWVKDTGIGIPADLQERIFEPFVTGNEPHGQHAGIGLGLSITRRLVALHRGVLTLESQPGRGATFHVYLPLLGQVEDVPCIAAAEPAILTIAARDEPAPGIAELGRRMALPIRRLRAGDELATLLTTLRPVVVAWDATDERPGDWSLIQHIRSHPRLCHVPFILYQDDQAAGSMSTTNVVLKPISANTLGEMIKALSPTSAIGPVLIVDDDPQAREVYQRMVATALPEYPVRLADGGGAALALLAHETPSLIILDLMMPEIDGFAVLERIRSSPRTRSVPVLVMSGRMLTFDDIKRLEHARVMFHSKDTLTPDETAASMQRAVSGMDMLPEHTSVLVKRTLAYIHQNYMHTLSRQEIAHAIGVNKHYLSRIFHQEQGISPWDYLNRYRIKGAKQLLLSTDASITAIAAQVGFDNVSYFGRIFHKLVGCSPREFRQRPK